MCAECCMKCLYWWSGRCPYGGCYDDHRAKAEPREKITGEHWTLWSHCEYPGEQDHWCRGGYLREANVEAECPHYIRYEGQIIKECLYASVGVFQDGYIQCTLNDQVGCQVCYDRWEKEQE